MKPVLSIAVITYNQEKFISQTLDSILSQEHPYSYEIIIGDDCSTDATQKIIKEYAQKYSDVIKPIFNNPNLGIIKNYFNVINHCSGEYIMECAGDDYWLPGKVEKQIKFMETHPDIGMCYGQAKEWIEKEHRFNKKLFGSKRENITDLLNGNDIPAPTVCFRKKLIEQYMEEINPLTKNWVMEDYPEWLWFSSKSRIKFIKETLAVYRRLDNSVSHKGIIEKQFMFNKCYYEIASFFADYNSLPYKKVEDEKIYFYIYWDNLRKDYKIESYKELVHHYKKIEHKTLSLFLRRILSKHRNIIKYLR